MPSSNLLMNPVRIRKGLSTRKSRLTATVMVFMLIFVKNLQSILQHRLNDPRLQSCISHRSVMWTHQGRPKILVSIVMQRFKGVIYAKMTASVLAVILLASLCSSTLCR
jgi:hypothetical protein